jgi:hypothetical protein
MGCIEDAERRGKLIPPETLRAIEDVFLFGARKHPDPPDGYGWRQRNQYRAERAALIRHLVAAHENGTPYDKESGLLHLAHAAARLIIMLDLELQRIEQVIQDANKEGKE